MGWREAFWDLEIEVILVGKVGVVIVGPVGFVWLALE